MKTEDAVVENKGKIRMLEFRIQALINILSKEGVIVKTDVKEEFDNLLKVDESED